MSEHEKLEADLGLPEWVADFGVDEIAELQEWAQTREDAVARAKLARNQAEATLGRLRAVSQVVVDAYDACRESNSMQGFWTVLDDLAAELDGRALAASTGKTRQPLPRRVAKHLTGEDLKDAMERVNPAPALEDYEDEASTGKEPNDD